ncbi:TPA: PTS lactose transporter subunit IIBC [Streptococcus suis]|nr:PTS lactose transporter subunit IIBC [Streptococcus suis]HEL2170739.1 PTS lactose transporter subunit IIBC [Streptococcus suis]HEL2511354.1 PTS lactose transporter subunit IIBC [Streptococcus suis]
MNKLIEFIEKGKPFFEKISRNPYLRAIRDGFIAAMPVILFSSIFLLVAFVPNIFGFTWSDEAVAAIMKPYGYTMGIVAVLVAGTTAKSLTDAFNRQLPKTNQINFISTMIASISGFLLLASDGIEGGFANGYMGTKGLLTAFLAAFITVNIYKVCVKNNVTIRMPDEVPPNVSQAFKDVIPYALSIFVLYGIDLVTRQFLGTNVAEAILKLFEPLFTAADGYVGITIIFGAYALFWFVGIHGPSIVEPAIAAITYANIETNFQLLQAGQHADKILTSGTQMFIVTMGGTGATLVVPFILAPIANVWIFKFFVDTLKMNSFSVNLPWTTPGPLGIVMGTNFAPLAFALAILLVVVDVLIYYPFLKVYDEQILAEEQSGKVENSLKEKVAANFNTAKADAILEKAAVDTEISEQTNVLVLCAGGGTSGLLANALTKAAKEYGVPVTATAGSYGAHREILPEYQLVILAPQVASNYDDMKQETDALGIKLAKTEGAQYIKLTRDGQGALDFVKQQF